MWQAHDKFMGVGVLGRLHHFFPAGSRSSIGNVLIDTAGKQIHILLHHSHIPPKAFQRHPPDVLPVYENLSLCGIIESGNQIAQRGLAAPRWSYQSHLLSGPDGQVYLGQYRRMVIRIFKRDLPKADGTLHILKGDCPFLIENVNVRVHQLRETLDTRHPALKLLRKFDDPADGGQQSGDIHGIGHQISGGNQPLHHENTACHDHHNVHESVKNADGILERRHIFIGLTLDLQELLIVVAELFQFQRLVGKGPHHLVPQKTVFYPCIQLSDMVPLALKGLAHLQVEIGAGNRHYGYQHKNDSRQQQIHSGQNHERNHGLYKRDKKLLRTVVGEFRHVK